MDLRMCPACQQSVLDDEAQLCPFCGAAMDGSSGPTTPAAPKKPAKKAEAAPKAAPVEEKPADPDDPFAVKKAPARKVIQLKRKPTAKISYRVICPMCDTSGFGTPAVAGKEVKCPNPECLVPIFTAPEEEKEELPPPKKPLVTPVTIFAGIAVLAVIGVGIFFWLESQKPTPKPDFTIEAGGNGPINNNPVTTEDPEDKKPDLPPEPEFDAAKFRSDVLAKATENALQRNNRSKPFSRQLNAQAFAEIGDIPEALKQLEAFDRVAAQQSYYKITPLVRIASAHLDAGNNAAATAMVDQALELAEKLPNTGSEAAQHVVALSDMLISQGRYEDALTLLQKREQEQEVKISEMRLAIAVESNSFDLDESYKWLSELKWSHPLTFATAYTSTVMHGQEAALGFIKTIQNETQKAEAVAGMVSAVFQDQSKIPANISEWIPASVGEISDTNKQLIVAQSAQSLSGKPGASIIEFANSLPAEPKPVAGQIPNEDAIYEGDFSFATPETLVRIQVERLLARYFARSGELETAWKHLESALKYAQSLGPASKAVEDLIAETERNRSQIQARLANKLNLDGDLASRSAFFTYRNNALKLSAHSEARKSLEERVLQNAIDWGLGSLFANSYVSAASGSATAEGEAKPVITSGNMNDLIENKFAGDMYHALMTTDQAQADAFTKIVPTAKSIPSPLKEKEEIDRLVEANNFRAARDKIRDLKSAPELLELRYATHLCESVSADKVADWILTISSPIEQEIAYRFAGALLARKEVAVEFWKANLQRNLSATDRCSLILGITEGIVVPEKPAEEEESEQ